MTLAAALLFLLVPQGQVPGLITVPAGKTAFGADLKTQKKLIEAHPSAANELGAEVPRSTVELPAFAIAPTETTNEMYLRFVKATGYQPPVSWMVLSPEQRQQIITEEQKKDPAFKFEGLRKSKWWDEHWQDEGMKWEMAPEAALLPVVGVSRDDADAYCRWAGLRLPTEREWVRAARGDDTRDYPFGDTFDRKLVACENTLPRNLAFKRLPVNSLPGNASPFGCVDMAGNVWEWTSSGFSALPGFKSFSVRTKELGKLLILPSFDASAAVIRGGAYNMPGYGERIDRRAGIFKVARSEFVGFRLASSFRPCANALQYATRDIEALVLGDVPQDVIDITRSVGVEKRRYAPLDELAKERKPPKGGIPAAEPPEGYAVFDGYECVAVGPLKSVADSSASKLSKHASQKPVPLGILHLGFPCAEPSLLPGTYVIAYQAPIDAKRILEIGADLPPKEQEEFKGAVPEPLEDSDLPTLKGIELAAKTSYLFLIDNTNTVLAALPMRKAPGYVLAKKTHDGVTVDLDRGTLDLAFSVPDPRGRKAFTFKLALKPLDQGASRVAKDYWDGDDYTVLEPQEDK